MATFNWKHSDDSAYVEVWGSFNDWTIGIPLRKDPKFVHSIALNLAPGIYEYKFKVNGKWCHDMTKPVTGPNSNNYKVVEKENVITIVHISDTHSLYHNVLPDGDILVHTGDFSIGGHYKEYEMFNNWVNKFDFKHNIMVLGNHDLDYYMDHMIDPFYEANKMLTNVSILSGHSNIMGINFYGQSWNYNHDWEYRCKKCMPNDNTYIIDTKIKPDIVLTHGPAIGIHGSKQLYQQLVKIKPSLHLSGHIHYNYGFSQHNGTYYVNGSSVSEDSSKIINKPFVIKYDNKNHKVLSIRSV